jgi:8-oxo-dGTP pyrophosphatase MutT (NUDIX family)
MTLETQVTLEPPRRSATVLLVRDDPFQVLMVTRHQAATFASALVFPGGAIDTDDESPEWLDVLEKDRSSAGLPPLDRAVRIGAIRETWEEASILVAARSATPSADPVTPAPHQFGQSLRSVVDALDARLNLTDLVEFAHWVTPKGQPRRYDTWFFLAEAPPNQPGVSDGTETVGLEWISPAEAIAAAARGERAIVFPTLMNLRRLAESSTVAEALAAARARAPFTVHPRREIRADGVRMLVVDAAAGYPVSGLPEPV